MCTLMGGTDNTSYVTVINIIAWWKKKIRKAEDNFIHTSDGADISRVLISNSKAKVYAHRSLEFIKAEKRGRSSVHSCLKTTFHFLANFTHSPFSIRRFPVILYSIYWLLKTSSVVGESCNNVGRRWVVVYTVYVYINVIMTFSRQIIALWIAVPKKQISWKKDDYARSI